MTSSPFWHFCVGVLRSWRWWEGITSYFRLCLLSRLGMSRDVKMFEGRRCREWVIAGMIIEVQLGATWDQRGPRQEVRGAQWRMAAFHQTCMSACFQKGSLFHPQSLPVSPWRTSSLLQRVEKTLMMMAWWCHDYNMIKFCWYHNVFVLLIWSFCAVGIHRHCKNRWMRNPKHVGRVFAHCTRGDVEWTDHLLIVIVTSSPLHRYLYGRRSLRLNMCHHTLLRINMVYLTCTSLYSHVSSGLHVWCSRWRVDPQFGPD